MRPRPPSPPPKNPTPDNPFSAWFSVDEAQVRRVLADLTANGADHAELYFQHKRSNSIVMEDGIINRASASVDLGVGLRVVVGDQVGYAYTEDLSPEAMSSAAKAAAAIAQRKAQPTVPERFSHPPRAPAGHYKIGVPWE